jgi:hypothetical protein
MNPKILYAGTFALALVSSLAFADEVGPLTRADSAAETSRPQVQGNLHRGEQGDVAPDRAAASTRSRADVIAEMAQARRSNTLLGPLRNRTYNPFGSELQRPSTVTRNEVKAEVAGAVHDGSLRRSDYDDVPVTVSRRVARERSAPARTPAAQRSSS